MKNTAAFVSAVLLAVACEVLDFRPDAEPGTVPGPEPEQPAPPPVLDTFLLVSAVAVPQDYDWRRDTACGAVSCEIVLYKDMERQFALSTASGVSPDPDMHHLIGGHLYAEGSVGDRTVIWRDESILVDFEGREYLLGILDLPVGVYTLTRRRSGAGFAFRKDGVLVYGSETGKVFGDLFDTAYPPTGALYLDGEEPCFCFLDGYEFRRRVYVCRDGVAAAGADLEFADEVLDARCMDGKLSYLVRDAATTTLHIDSAAMDVGKSRALEWDWAGLGKRSGGEWFITGDFRQSGASASGMLEAGGRVVRLGDSGSRLYREGDAVVALPRSRQETQDYYFFSSRCACLFGGELYQALTPRAKGKKLKLRLGPRDTELEINGFLTGIDVAVVPQ